ncbi:hypothetical protein FH968_19830 [Buttiauxella sp. B2]|uniref:type II secretion system F family protein n=1 Tax=Buttiauxella sp. B2 TaxID=2587812 RepID=UPI00111D7B04|nr:type II secretion system F family protein [Buttiauxella sp. B2]TNV16094.1 hypothetical protein FH968_19830 [Buttiauxella sp. B2]
MNKFQRFVYRNTFNTNDRSELYDNFRQYLLDGLDIETTLKKLILNYTRRGKKPNDPIALILEECSHNIAEGMSLSQSLAYWIPEQELTVIEANAVVNKAQEGFLRAITIAEGTGRIYAAIKSAVLNAFFTFSMAMSLLSIVCIMIIPILLQIIPLEKWEFSQKVIYYLYVIITGYSYIIVIFLAGGSYLIYWSFSRWTGNLRFHFDKYPPWSLYKNMYGATFILSMNAMLSSGINLEAALNRIKESSNSDWFIERINATINGLSEGQDNLGTALDVSGYEFPSEEAIIKMQSLFETRNKEGSLERFGHKWLEKTISNIETIGGRLKYFSMFFLAFSICAIVIILSGLIQKAFFNM